MILIKKNLVLLICSVLLTLLFTTSAVAVPTLQVQVDGKSVEFDVSPFIENGDPMAPIRQLGEAAGGKVEWDAEARTAWIHKAMMHMEIPIGKSEFYIHRDADFSGIPQIVKLKAPIKIVQGRTILPALTLVESLGLTANWDEAAKTIMVKTDEKVIDASEFGVVMNSTTVKSMELYTIDQEKIRDCSETEKSAVIEAFNKATVDENFYIQMITGRVLKVTFNDGSEASFTSYGSKTNVVAKIQIGDAAKSYHLAVPAIAELLLETD